MKKNIFADEILRYDSEEKIGHSSFHHLVAIEKNYCKAEYWKKRNSSMLAKYSSDLEKKQKY